MLNVVYLLKKSIYILNLVFKKYNKLINDIS